MRKICVLCEVLGLILVGVSLFAAADENAAQTVPGQAMTEPFCCPVLELRQYTLHPGKRDVLVELFDREFVEAQEELGMKLPGQFRDLDRPDRFVWLRGFPNMEIRKEALNALYTGPVWKANSKAANATMIDASNVLLLRPATRSSGFRLAEKNRLTRGTTENPGGIVIATIHYLQAPANEHFLNLFESKMKPALVAAGDSIVGYFVTEYSENTFPALPVREGEHVFVVFSLFPDLNAYNRFSENLYASAQWKTLSSELKKYQKNTSEILRLSPTSRSLLHK